VGNPDPRRFSAFLCHASGDKELVRALHHRLSAEGVRVWFDETNLLPGQDWEREIRKAVRAVDVVLVCLSPRSINKSGFVQKEIKYALDVADEKPDGRIFIVPVRIEECDVPERLRRWHWVDLFSTEGYEKLLAVLSRPPEECTDFGSPVRRSSRLRVFPKSSEHFEAGDIVDLLRSVDPHSEWQTGRMDEDGSLTLDVVVLSCVSLDQVTKYLLSIPGVGEVLWG
jgi:hypothetical protein